MKILAIFNKTKFGKPEKSNHVEAYGDSTIYDMPILKIELAGNPNSCIIK